MNNITTNTDKYPKGLLAELRALRPARRLNPHEARSVAERQAALLLKRTATDPPVSLDLLDFIPRLQVQHDHELPDVVAGSSHWTGTHWLINLNARHPERRQRFTAFHELHHTIEHSVQRFNGGSNAEALADHFSACVLMPRTLVKQAWCGGTQNLGDLADLFNVSEDAMRVRLIKLGLLDGTRHDCRRIRRIYYRLAAPRPAAALLPIPISISTNGGSL